MIIWLVFSIVGYVILGFWVSQHIASDIQIILLVLWLGMANLCAGLVAILARLDRLSGAMPATQPVGPSSMDFLVAARDQSITPGVLSGRPAVRDSAGGVTLFDKGRPAHFASAMEAEAFYQSQAGHSQ